MLDGLGKHANMASKKKDEGIPKSAPLGTDENHEENRIGWTCKGQSVLA